MVGHFRSVVKGCSSGYGESDTSTVLSIIIPVYNEAASLRHLHDELHWACAYLPSGSPPLQEGEGEGVPRGIEMVYVDDGSTDASWSVIAELAARDARVVAVRLRRNCGKATAYAAGLAHARGDTIATIDADLQDDPAELGKLLAQFGGTGGADMVIGYKERRQDAAIKLLSSRLFNAALRAVAGTTLRDHNSGFRVMTREVADALPLRGDLHRVLPAIAAMHGYRVAEVPVAHRARRFGVSKYGRTGLARTFRGLFDVLTVAFLYRFRARPLHFFGAVGLALFGIGIAINAYLSAIWIAGASIGTRPLLLLGVLLVVLGVQFISTGFLADLVVLRREREEALPIREVLRA